MKFKLSARDKEQSDIKYDDEDFSAESKLNFSTEFNVSTLATTMWDLGYHDVASITKQLKERNIPMDATAKEIIKAVVDKMTPTELTASWKSYLKKTAGDVESWGEVDPEGDSDNAPAWQEEDRVQSIKSGDTFVVLESEDRADYEEDDDGLGTTPIIVYLVKRERDGATMWLKQEQLTDVNYPNLPSNQFPGEPIHIGTSWKSYIKKADLPFRGDEPVDPSELRPKQRGCQHDFDDYYKGNKLISECKKCGYSFENR